MKNLENRVKNLIYRLSVTIGTGDPKKEAFHLDYNTGVYRQSELVRIIRDTVPYFALTKAELAEMNSESFSTLISRAWKRISNRPKEKKGDYGELLLFLLLEVFYPAKKLITKVRLRSSLGDEIKGFDCAHFTVVGGEIRLWLGEAKFHQDFSTGISSAIKSINEHIEERKIRDEMTILESNSFEVDEDVREKVVEYLNSGLSFERIHITFPILLTYDSSTIPKHASVDVAFIQSLQKELNDKCATIDLSSPPKIANIELLFILLPLESVAKLKSEIESIEMANK